MRYDFESILCSDRFSVEFLCMVNSWTEVVRLHQDSLILGTVWIFQIL
jgi:hypothetical protein